MKLSHRKSKHYVTCESRWR